ncbi:bifunctional methylenetetrahydrofolate dehydrogenase/cyclohydrolase, mitochondrial-like [Paramacrobiotus metropolitanus]|uniref:bifunctional methylenetetrahydrofolate dehydrogenase/cyclohydrolase, mitochondrial-like n=1 Tax=Paramacrobiotus metropolitanus TaxID=2943436 RepID=UPI002445ACAE|nr:bifunctional methylenetetrahydrofolate dehydrogenase/cyclohydrolase, mitochondrial-like [Paramacrobiotus metropolitanus]XP_055343276.1 bifunctional methylenetetrahydrofolate dehydrogenase/cyclohydrolase, mitochondrial-like [Paramacrobiotus metropolitanus]
MHSTTTRSQAQILDGKKLSKEILSELKSDIDVWSKAGNRRPHLSVIMVGNNPASLAYIANKVKAAEKVGVTSNTFRLPESVSQSDLLNVVESLNTDRNTDGILVQFPLPAHLSEHAVCEAVSAYKDVDGFHVLNMGQMVQGREGLYPCTPLGVMELLKRNGVETFGKNAVICGRSKNVGMPIMMLMHADGHGDATTTICHRHTPPEQMKLFTKMADILITAVGKPGLITADMVKEGVIVVDVGITRVREEQSDKFVLKGDVDFEGVSEKASYITPVPGGVGPMTVCMLIKNTFIAAKKLRGFDSNLEFLPSKKLTEVNFNFMENLRKANVATN